LKTFQLSTVFQDNSEVGVRYFEVHLDPQKLASEDASMEAVLQAVLRGLKGRDDVGLGSFILLFLMVKNGKMILP
jgi:hypothetical protein